MKTLILLTLLVIAYFPMRAQQVLAKAEKISGEESRGAVVNEKSSGWEFALALKDYLEHDCAKAQETNFGREIACLLSVMDERYLHKIQVTGGDVAVSTQIQKPVVYNAVKRIEKYFRAKVRKGCFTVEDRSLFEHVIKVAIACVEEDSLDFEEALKQSKKDLNEQIQLFQRVRLNSIYE